MAMVLIAGQGISVMAQQLPNSGFETWVDCYPWSSKTNTDGPYKGTNAQGQPLRAGAFLMYIQEYPTILWLLPWQATINRNAQLN